MTASDLRTDTDIAVVWICIFWCAVSLGLLLSWARIFAIVAGCPGLRSGRADDRSLELVCRQAGTHMAPLH